MANNLQSIQFSNFDAGISKQDYQSFEYSDNWSFSFTKTVIYDDSTYSDTYITSGYKIKNGLSNCVHSDYYNQWKNSAIEYTKTLKNTNDDYVDEVDPENNMPADRTNQTIQYNNDWRKNPDRESKENELTKRLNNMSDKEKQMIIKFLQLDILLEMMDVLKNLKDTTEKTWKDIINKCKQIVNIKIKDIMDFDFDDFIKILLPLLAALAAIMIGLKQSKSSEIESSDTLDEELNSMREKIQTTPNNNIKSKSVVLSMCEKEINGFSLK